MAAHHASLTKRILTPEHMDDPRAAAPQQAEALDFIRLVNDRFGGVKAAIGHFSAWSAEWPKNESIRVLDIGTGSADIPLAMVKWAQQRGISLKVTAVDSHPVTLNLARQHIVDCDAIELVECDALKLMDRFTPGAFDVVHAGMFLHHLDDVQALTVLAMMDRLAVRGMIWNDLVRGAISRAAVQMATIGLPAHVRHDARVSVKAGFTRYECINLARRAGWNRPEYARHLCYRFTLVSKKM